MKKVTRSIGTITLACLIGSCGGGDGVVGPPPPTTDSVTMSATTATVVPGANFQLSATARDRSGNALSRILAWSSSDPSKATVSSSGMVAGVAPGTTTITAAVDGKSATSTVTVLDGGVVSSAGATLTLRSGEVQIVVPADALTSSTSLSVVPSAAYVNDPRVVKNTPFDFGPTGTTFAKPVSIKIKYQATDLPQGTEEPALQIHLATSTGWQAIEGSVVDLSAKTVTANVSHFSVYAILTPLPVAAVAIGSPPEKPIVNGVSTLVVGDGEQLTATPTDAQGAALANRAITWVTSNATIASVTPGGLVTALSPGNTTVSATVGGVTSSITVTVTPVPVAAVAVSLAAPAMQVGQTSQASAVVTDAAGHVLTGRTVVWSSDNTSVATVAGNTGVVTAVNPGTANITGTSEGKAASTPITVSQIPVSSIAITPASAGLVLALAPTQQLTATLKDANGNVLTGRTVAWSSSLPGVATVDASGLVTAVAAGNTTITATSEGKDATAAINVSVTPVASVTVALSSNSITAVGTSQATATTSDANGGALTGRAIVWGSGDQAVATVDAQGVITAVGVGATTITATSEGKSGSATITVTPAPVATITLSPPTVTLVDGTTQQLTPTLKDVRQNVLTGRAIHWSTDEPLIATVSADGLVSALSPGVANIAAESEGQIARVQVTVTATPVATVNVSLASGSLIAGQTTQATATTLDGSGNTLTGRVITWASDNTTVATVSSTGLVTSLSPGTANIIATSETKAGHATLTVTPVPVALVTVNPASADVVLGGTQQLTATTKDAGGTTLTGRVVTWSSDNTSVASVDPATGLVTAHAIGSATITATSEGKTGPSSITVVPIPVASVNVLLTPSSITAVGTSQATATTLDGNGGTLTGRVVTWSSSNTAVATVSALGVVTAVAEGSASIHAISEGKIGSATITVTQAPVATVDVIPPSATLFQGETEQLAVTLKDSHENVLTGRAVTWSSNNPSVASVSASGLVTAGVPGSATITATSEGQSGSASIGVSMVPVASVTVTLGAGTINVGQNTQASATLRDAGGNVLSGRPITWTSDNTSVATVSSSGVVTALAVGTTHITATSGGQSGNAPLTVTPIPVASVSVSMASPLEIGRTTQASAITRDANNNVLAGRAITWSSDNAAAATVSSTGLVTAVAAGSANISATSEGVPGSASVTVIPVPVASLTLSAPTTPVILGQTQQLTANPKDAGGVTLTGRTVNWVSSNPAVLSVSAASSVSTSSGATITVTAAGVGTAIITASSEAAPSASTPVITVNPIPVATVTVSPASVSLALGVTPTQQLTAVTKDANGNVLSGRLVTWSSSNPAAATVDATGFVTAVGGGVTTITATSETKTGTSSITVTVPVATVTVAPLSVTLPVNATHQLVATTSDLNGNPLSGRLVTWSSSDATRATVSSTGLLTALAVGPATITATSEGKTGTSSITVTQIPVASVSVSLAASTIQVGQTTQATATTFDAGDNILTGRVVTWSTGNSAVATISSSGVIAAVGPGSTTITATSEGKAGTAGLTVIPVPVASVSVSPSSANVTVGSSQQLSAETRDANNIVLTGRAVTWSSNNTAVATVDAGGVVNAVSVGGATITATSEGKSGTSSITVVPVPVASVTVTLTPSSITAVGTSQATAATLDANGIELTGRAVTWTSSNSSVATVSPQGLITAIAVGTTSVTATSEGKSGNAALTVTPAPVATVTVIPPSAIVFQGETEQLAVTLKDAHDNVLTGRTVTWSSSNTSVATVSTTGLVTAIVPGAATITALSEGQSGTASITVSLVPVASVSVTLAASTITDAQSTQATATLRDADGNVLTGRTVTWNSDNTAVATVSPAGVVTPVAPGSTQIRATSGGQNGSAALTVIPSVSTVTVTPPSPNVVIGTTLQLAAETRDASNNVLTGRTVTWSSSNPSIATVSTSGLVTANALGGATITATSEGMTGTSSITVVQVPVFLVTVSLGSTTIVVGQTTQATAMTRDASGNILTGRSVTWSSGNPAVATVSSAGVVTAVGAGTVQIIAMSEGKTGSATLTVNPPPVASLVLSAPATPMIVGGTQTLTAQPKDAGGNTLSGRTVNWVSSNTAVLMVSAATSVSTASGATITVTAVGSGSATISASSESAPSATTASIAVNPVPVATVTVSPTTANLVLGITPTQQLSAVTKDANGTVLTGRLITWSSNNTAAATVSGAGLVTAVGAGAATITATSEGKSGTSSITVALAPVATVTVTPATANLVLGITPTQQLTAVTKDANGNVLTGRSVTWISSNTAAATVSTTGLVTASGAGATTITATSEGQSGTSSITVTLAPVATVTVSTPTTPMIAGATQQLTATTRDANGNLLSGRVITWASSNTSVLTVGASGSPVTVTAAGIGTATITATSESVSSAPTPAITVNPVPVATVTVTPSTANLVLGITPTQQLTAVPKDANGNALSGRVVTWNSSNTATATVDATGLVTAVGAGSSTITATSEGQSGTSSVSVAVAPVASVTVSLSPTSITAVGTSQATATTLDANGHTLTGRVITWSSDNTAVATVSGSGVVSAVAAGTANIIALSEGQTGSAQLTVTPAPVATVTVSPTTATLVLGITPTQQLTGETKDANGNVLTGRAITWVSSNTAAATVDGTGLVTAVAAGATTITATSETKTGTSQITVTIAPVTTVALSAPTTPMTVGDTQVLTAAPMDANANPLSGRTVNWVSSGTAVLTVSAATSVSTSSGATITVTAVGPGTATITATSESAPEATTPTITVNPIPVATVTVTPSTASLVLGITPTQQLTAVTKDAGGNELTGRVVTWTSDNNAIATVDANGLVTAVAAGSAAITGTSEGKTGTSSITVSLAPVATVTVSAPTTPMTVGQTQQLIATTKDANDHVLSGRTVTWGSSNTAVLTVSASGSTATATAVGVGTATITATSESVSSTPTPTITVDPAPVATITLSSLVSPMAIGGVQVLTAIPKDALGNNLSGRTVNWVSSDQSVLAVSAPSSVSTSSGATITVTGIAAGTATITASSESAPSATTPSVTVSPSLAAGPLRVSTVNPRYFANPAGRVIYLTGSEYWKTIQDNSPTDPPAAFDYPGFLDSLQIHNHNFTRLYMWEQARWSAETSESHWFSPTVYSRVDTGTALDGGHKFDLNQINPAYLARVRQRVIDARDRGIYVSVMLFNGWSLGTKPNSTAGDPWLAHPFNAANNINGINGDTDGDGRGAEIQTLAMPEVTALQEAYVRAVIDAVNDLDNVIYEISNESDQSADAWQYHMINFIHSYEATKPKQHPVGMTVPFPTFPQGTNADVLNSPAEWVSMNGDINDPAPADGSKVSLSDTDHLCGICGDPSWPWKSLMQGHNTLFMDGYDGSAGVGDPKYDPTNPVWHYIREYMGDARSFAVRIDLAHALPRGNLSSSGFCLAVDGSEYLVLLPAGGSVTVDLSAVSGTRTVEWYEPKTKTTQFGTDVSGGGSVTFTSPFNDGNITVLYIHR